MKRKIGVYLRVSTKDKQDVNNQLFSIKQFLSLKGWELDEGLIFQDKDSGSKDDRAGLLALQEHVTKKKVNTVIVYAFDRASRSLKKMLELLDFFNLHGCDFISVRENIDTSTPIGKCLFSICSALSELEKSNIQARIKASLARKKAEGVQLGRPRKGFDIAKAIELRKQGLGYRKVAELLGVKKSTLHSALKDCPENLIN